MINKLNTFMLSGVKEYWVIDPSKYSVLVYSFVNYEIDEYTTYKSGDVLHSYFFEGLEIEVDQIFET